MDTNPRLLNPNGILVANVERRLSLFSKTKSLWVKKIVSDQEVQTIEGLLSANAGDFLCRGIAGELWPQRAEKLREKYIPSGEIDSAGWERFAPKPGAAPVNAAKAEASFRVISRWGELFGKANDYVVCSTTDPTDIWIVDGAIFETSYRQCDVSSEEQKSIGNQEGKGLDLE